MEKNKSKLFVIILLILITSTNTMGEVLGPSREVIVGFNKPVGPSEKSLIQNHGGIIKNSFHLIPAIVAKVPENQIGVLKQNPNVAYIENDRIFMAADEYTYSWGVQHIGSQPVHNQSTYGDGVKIAVLDTGIDYTHPELNASFKGGVSFVTDSYGNIIRPDGYDDSGSSHGTHVAGVIAAANNGIGVIGVAPNASVYSVKVLGGDTFGTASWIIAGIEWAVDNKMDIISMSLSSMNSDGSDVESLRLATQYAYDNGSLLIAAAGNNKTGTGPVQYPAAFDSVIAVAATNQTDEKASFSTIGPEIEISAPGVHIYSTIKGGSYAFKDGTSMATPHVTGVAALIYQANKTDANNDSKIDNKDVRKILQDTARDLGDTGKDNVYGYGIVDAQKAILGTEYVPEPGPEPTPIPEPFITDLTLLRTIGSPIHDAKNASLSQEGNYSVLIKNINLSKLDMIVLENNTIRINLSSLYVFNGQKEINKNLYVKNPLDIIFIPYGNLRSVGYVTIRRI